MIRIITTADCYIVEPADTAKDDPANRICRKDPPGAFRIRKSDLAPAVVAQDPFGRMNAAAAGHFEDCDLAGTATAYHTATGTYYGSIPVEGRIAGGSDCFRVGAAGMRVSKRVSWHKNRASVARGLCESYFGKIASVFWPGTFVTGKNRHFHSGNIAQKLQMYRGGTIVPISF